MISSRIAPSPSDPSLLQSKLLLEAGFQHGFFTRKGGVSDGVFDSLNFVANTGDSQENVKRNLEIVGEKLQVSPDHIYFLSQVHGVDHLVATPDLDRTEVLSREGDIVLTQDSQVAAAIRTADCVSVLLGCRKTGWVAACHSGWQGCEKGAAVHTVRTLREQGASDLVAAIGPHISLEAFEVSPDVAERLAAASPDPDIVHHGGEKPHVDLRKMVRSQLMQEGIETEDIDDVLGCTVLDPTRFFSFRRDKNPSGRLLSAIVGRGK